LQLPLSFFAFTNLFLSANLSELSVSALSLSFLSCANVASLLGAVRHSFFAVVDAAESTMRRTVSISVTLVILIAIAPNL
jgi:hypothetical protein